ncbi:MAG: type II secretion system protein [Planctomycetota bacterium]
MTRSTRVNAFTIIELLVVISIISLLTAILIPALAAVKNSSKMVLCKSNLRQLVLANQNYANDYHGYSVPGAFNLDVANLHRWYGTKSNSNVLKKFITPIYRHPPNSMKMATGDMAITSPMSDRKYGLPA